MKFGMRKPSLKKSIKARTTGKVKRAMKKAVNPMYGKKGMGYINNPKKAVYNKVYNKTTFGINDIVKSDSKKTNSKNTTINNFNSNVVNNELTITREQAYREKVEPLLKQINAYTHGLEKAETPYWFFWIYKNAEKSSKELLQYEDKLEWKVGTPTEALNELIEKKQIAIKLMIERYYNSMIKKSKRFNVFKINYKEIFFNELNKYKNELNEENIQYIQRLYNEWK